MTKRLLSLLLALLPLALFAEVTSIAPEPVYPEAAMRALAIKDNDFKQTGREPISAGFVAPDNSHVWSIGELDLSNIERLGDVSVTFRRPDGSIQVRYEAPEARWIDGEWWLCKAG